MADPRTNKDPHHSFEDSHEPIGQVTFPLSELDARTEERDRAERATEYAIEQSEEGFPEDDNSDLDEDDGDL